ncbi:undecaprenyl-phosphate glucose phosphotransferase [Adhaeretor mobilis]|uniref:UDP-glucose:undecaprenyl-phosphate glucose-1-phosphate transferase n=1 Tax=Adhaeretor mobilis TaxID=1930276 RepID=A0A517MVT4_9BACT|nr:undecaprenyl-phosphate glucose phosphotransferase [Adhaeretor mobilis]QDS98989.1 UDP-glucose:undecaprenyl-phosphate glucose-1-phosphate transferase [Adhaeretor mobilis]
MFSSSQFQVRQHRSLVDVTYRLLDAAAILASTIAATRYSELAHVEALIVVGATTWLLHMVAVEISGLYRSWRGARLSNELWCVLVNWLYLAPAVLGVGLLTRYNVDFSYQTKVVWLTLTPIAMASGRVLLRFVLRSLRRRGLNTRQFAICGVNKLGVQLARNVSNSPELGLGFAGYYDDRPEARTAEQLDEAREHRGDLAELVHAAREGKIDIIFITFPMRAEDRIRDYLNKLGDTTASVYIVPDFFVFQMLHARWSQIDGLPVVSVFETPISGIDGVIKRGFDLVAASALLVLLTLPMLAVAAMVKFTSPGPIFFRQKRYGLSGEEIHVWKFRSMRVHEESNTVRQATKGDDRITSVGEVIRQTSLDELPQLFNVLEGSMSLVGPRPHATAHNEQYRTLINGYMLRHKVKPGITGLAQVNGWRGETETLEKMQMRVEFDHRYIREWSLWMDLKILFKTVLVVLKQENAY